MSRKIGHFLLLILILTMVLTSCNTVSTTANTVATTKTSKPEKVVLFNNFGNPWASGKAESVKAVFDSVHQKILDDINVDVQVIIPPSDSAKEKLNLMLTSGDEIGVFAGDYRQYYKQDVILPLNDLLSEYGSDIKRQWKASWNTSWEVVTKDGNIWAIPRLPALFERMVWFRMDWLKKIDKSLLKTIDEYEEILKLFKETDPAGNGTTIPLLTGDLDQLRMCMAGGFMDVGYGTYMTSDGKILPVECNPDFKNFVAKMADWYQKGYIFKETYSLTGDRVKELVKTNKVATAPIHETWITTPLYALKQNVPEADYQVAPNLVGPKGALGTCFDVFVGEGILISKKASSPAAAMKFINWSQMNLENYLISLYGIENVDWKFMDSEKYAVERLNTDYISDFCPATFAFTIQFSPADEASRPEFEFYRDYVTNLDICKKPFDYGIAPFYNMDEINTQLPNKEDITRMINEGLIKFLTCARPMSEYDTFIGELKSAGLDKWSEVMTAQYNSIKK